MKREDDPESIRTFLGAVTGFATSSYRGDWLGFGRRSLRGEGEGSEGDEEGEEGDEEGDEEGAGSQTQ